MNLSLFEKILKKEALKCYNGAIDSFYNNPFTDLKPNIKEDIFEFEVNQGLGKNAYKAVMDSNLSKQQIQYMAHLTNNYKSRIKTKILELNNI